MINLYDLLQLKQLNLPLPSEVVNIIFSYIALTPTAEIIKNEITKYNKIINEKKVELKYRFFNRTFASIILDDIQSVLYTNPGSYLTIKDYNVLLKNSLGFDWVFSVSKVEEEEAKEMIKKGMWIPKRKQRQNGRKIRDEEPQPLFL